GDCGMCGRPGTGTRPAARKPHRGRRRAPLPRSCGRHKSRRDRGTPHHSLPLAIVPFKQWAAIPAAFCCFASLAPGSGELPRLRTPLGRGFPGRSGLASAGIRAKRNEVIPKRSIVLAFSWKRVSEERLMRGRRGEATRPQPVRAMALLDLLLRACCMRRSLTWLLPGIEEPPKLAHPGLPSISG